MTQFRRDEGLTLSANPTPNVNNIPVGSSVPTRGGNSMVHLAGRYLTTAMSHVPIPSHLFTTVPEMNGEALPVNHPFRVAARQFYRERSDELNSLAQYRSQLTIPWVVVSAMSELFWSYHGLLGSNEFEVRIGSRTVGNSVIRTLAVSLVEDDEVFSEDEEQEEQQDPGVNQGLTITFDTVAPPPIINVPPPPPQPQTLRNRGGAWLEIDTSMPTTLSVGTAPPARATRWIDATTWNDIPPPAPAPARTEEQERIHQENIRWIRTRLTLADAINNPEPTPQVDSDER